jgi:hypothetical protein
LALQAAKTLQANKRSTDIFCKKQRMIACHGFHRPQPRIPNLTAHYLRPRCHPTECGVLRVMGCSNTCHVRPVASGIHDDGKRSTFIVDVDSIVAGILGAERAPLAFDLVGGHGLAKVGESAARGGGLVVGGGREGRGALMQFCGVDGGYPVLAVVPDDAVEHGTCEQGKDGGAVGQGGVGYFVTSLVRSL